METEPKLVENPNKLVEIEYVVEHICDKYEKEK